MEELSAQILSTPLNKLVIPGTHNSGSYSISYFSEYTVDAPEPILKSNFMRFVSRPIVYNYAICQNRTIYEQLKDGIRYLDFRVVKNKKEELGSICHSLDGDSFVSMLDQISKFIKEFPKEVIFIDIKKVYGYNEKELENWINLFEQYCIKTFGESICPLNFTTSTSIGDLWKNNFQLIFFLPFQTKLFWNFDLINRSWANKPDDQQVIKFIDEEILKHKDDDRLHLSEFIITVTEETIKQNLYSSLKFLAMKSNKEFMKSLKEKNNFNLVCCDFYEEFDYVSSCIEKNMKN
eukprot:gene8576-401_t